MKRFLYLTGILFWAGCLSAGAVQQNERLGEALFDAGKYPEAIHYFKKGLAHDPKNWRVWQSMGDAYSRLNLNDDALKAYGNSLKIHPSNPEVSGEIKSLSRSIPPSTVPVAAIAPEPPPVIANRWETDLKVIFPGYWGNTVDRNIWKNNFSLSFSVLRQDDPVFSFGGRVDYFLWQADSNQAGLKYSGTPFASFQNPPVLMRIVQVMPEMRIDLVPGPSPVRPYLTVGMGLLNKTFSDLAYSAATGPSMDIELPAQNSFSVLVGVGLPLQIDEVHRFFLEYERLQAWGAAGNDYFDNFNLGFAVRW
jgi:hypothetical protein